MTPSGIEPATIRFVAQHLNHCATAVPHYMLFYVYFLKHNTYFRTEISLVLHLIVLYKSYLATSIFIVPDNDF